MEASSESTQRSIEPSVVRLSSSKLVVGWTVTVLCYSLLIPTQLITGWSSIIVTDLAWTIAALLATIGCARAARVLAGRDRLAWLLFAAACAAWTAGQVVWDIYELAMGVLIPFPSVADAGYVMFGLLMNVGLMVLRTTQQEHRLTWLRIANLGLILCGLAVVLIVMLTQPFRRAELAISSSFILVLESASIAIAFILALYVLWSYRWGERFEPLALLTVGLAIHMISALFYTRGLATEQYSVLSPFNVGWLLGFAALHLAGESQVEAIRFGNTSRARIIQEKQGWVEALVPSVLLLCIAITAFALRQEITPRVTYFGSIVLAVFGIVLAVREVFLYVRGQQTRAELTQAAAELRASRESLSEMDAQRLQLQRDIELTARAGAVGLWDWDLRTNTVRYTREWKRQLGFEDDEIGDTIDEWRSRVHPDDLQRMLTTLDEFVANPHGEFIAEQRLRHRDGSYRWILVQGSILVGEDGELQRVLGSHVDITERKLIELSLRESQSRYRELVGSLETRVAVRTRELTDAYRESQSFAYAVAHDLKAPLRAIDGFSHLLEQSTTDRLNANEQTYIKRIRHGAMHMASLIDGLLAYSRLEHRELRFCALDSRALVADILRSLEVVLQAAKAEVTVTVPATPVRADMEGLRIVLRNLLDNALKFASPSRPSRIEIGGYVESGCLVIFVRDNGIGFDAQYHDKIFEIFNRLHSTGYEGTGIGLALVRKAMQRMHGSVWATATLDEGATFFVKLPLAEDAAGG